MTSVLTMAAFLRRNWAPCRNWPRERLLGWLGWIWQQDAVASVTKGHRLTAVGIARPVETTAQARDRYAIAPHGAILWVDVAAATNTQALALLLRQARDRWGERLFIGYYRRHGQRVVLLPYGDFMKRFQPKEQVYGR